MSPQRASDEASPLLGHSAPHVPGPNAPHEAHPPIRKKDRTVFALRITAAAYSFVVLGLLGSSVGAMLQHISRHYAITDLHVSLIFLAAPMGYLPAAQANNFIHSRFGQRGVALLGPIFHLLSTTAIAVSPPFPAVLVAFTTMGTGTGLLDGSWCAWVASMSSANAVSGLLHGSFSIGAAVGPLLATTMVSAGRRQWYEWYFVLAGASAIELVLLLSAFRYEDASRYRRAENSGRGHYRVDAKAMLANPAVWVSALYFLAYVGTETAMSGWVISFMTRARHATPTLASLASSGFWAGMAVGRVALGSVTDKFGVSQATLVYLLCVLLLDLLFATVHTQLASLLSFTMLGFFMGPLFPSGVVRLTQSLPKDCHITGVSFTASVGQVGGALLPFGIGAVIQRLGIGVFQYAIIVLSFVALMMWIVFTRLRSARSSAPYGSHRREEST